MFDEAARRPRASHVLASHTTLFCFLAGLRDLGREMRAQAVNWDLLRRAGRWDHPCVGTAHDRSGRYLRRHPGKKKEGSRVS